MEFIKRGKASIIVGGQFGSEAKGLAAAIMWDYPLNDVSFTNAIIHTTNAGAQAGHTTVMEDGKKFVCYHLPTAGVLNPWGRIYINAGAIIDIDVLRQEIEDVAQVTGESVGHLAQRITVNPFAAVISNTDKATEHGKEGTTRIGSTQKGVGSALINKIMRRPGSVVRDFSRTFSNMGVHVEQLFLNGHMDARGSVMIEIPQGTGLSINSSGFFPHCTSRECWLGQGLTDAGIHPHYLGSTAMVVRTYPIRVGHIYDAIGERIGDSGPWSWGSTELDWEKDFPGIEPERTTVTKRVRRIATWSRYQYAHALSLNRPDFVILTFCNYLKSAGDLMEHVRDMYRVERDVGISPRHIYSWGPKASQSSSYLTDVMLSVWGGPEGKADV